jgi:hypothetical protein
MSARGGKRPGAGRKPSGVKRAMYRSPIQLAEAKISERLPWLVDQLLVLAEGVCIERITKDGVQHVYQDRPDRQACEYLIDRILGKPSQPVSLSTTVREMAAAAGLTDEETAEAVAEAERLVARHSG